MPFVKGQSGNPNGRTPGIRDKRHQWYDVRAKFDEMGYDPVHAMIVIAQDESNDPQLRMSAHKELLSRVIPAIKALEIRPDDETRATLDEYAELKIKMDAMLAENKRDF